MFIQVGEVYRTYFVHMVIWKILGKRGFTFGSRYSGIKYVVKYASLLLCHYYFFFMLMPIHTYYYNLLESQLLNYRQQFNNQITTEKKCQSD